MKTIQQPFFTETEEKKSQFLSFLVPFADFEAEFKRLKAEHPKASHHVTAFRMFDKNKRLHEGSKDDGEPSGCAGVPTLKVLQGNNLVNIGIITVRYFGGTKLGTGGMARAYGTAAKAVVESADLTDFQHLSTVTLSARFDRISELERLISIMTILDRQYTEQGIDITLSGPEEAINDIKTEWETLNY